MERLDINNSQHVVQNAVRRTPADGGWLLARYRPLDRRVVLYGHRTRKRRKNTSQEPENDVIACGMM